MSSVSAGMTRVVQLSRARIVADLESVGAPGLAYVRLAVDLTGVDVWGRAAALGSCVVGVAFEAAAFTYLGAYGGGPGFLAPPVVHTAVEAGARTALVVQATVETQASPQTGVVAVARLCFLRAASQGWLHCELRGASAALRGPGGVLGLDLPVLRMPGIVLGEATGCQ